MMKKPLQVLILEDSADDAQLLLLQLEQDGIEVEWQRVETEAAFRAALDSQPDLILADYSLPSYSGIKALELRNELGLDIPFILVSGTMGEDIAVTAMQQGAADYLLKDRLARLGEAVRNALEEKRVRDEKRWAEEALHKSEERLRLLSEAAHDLTTLVNRQWIIEYTNTYAAQQFGVSPQELIGKKLTEIFPAEIANRQQTNLQKVFDSGQPLYVEAPSIFQGKTTWLGSWLVPVKDKLSDEANAILVVSRDITERKRAEEKLAASETELRALFGAMRDVVLVYDREGRYVQIAPTSPELLYNSAEVMLGKSVFDILPRALAQTIYDAIQEVLRTRRSIHVEYALTLDGENGVWMDAVASPLTQDTVFWIARDITERKQADEALRQSQASLENAEAQAHLGSWSFDPATQSGHWSKEMYHLFGRDPALGTPPLPEFMELIHPDDRGRLAAAQASILEGGESVSDDYRTNPERIPFRVLNAGFYSERDGDGKVVRVLGTALDITERKHAEEEINYQARLLRHINDAVIATDDQFRITAWNRAAEAIYGWTIAEVMGRNVAEILSFGLTDQQRVAAKELLKEGSSSRSERIHSRKNGRPVYVEENAIALIDEQHGISGYVSVNRDISERKQAEEQIQLQLQRLKALRAIDIAISSSFNLGLTLDILLDQVISQLKTDAAAVLLFNPVTEILEYAASRGFRSTAIHEAKVRLGEGYAGKAILERRTIHIPNLMQTDSELAQALLLKSEYFLDYYCVPLIVKGEVKGVLEIFHRSVLVGDPEWLDFLETLAGQAAIAVHEAALFENLQHSNRELFQAYDATIEGWSRALDLRDKETEGHTQRVTEMTLALARKYNFNDEELQNIRWGALLHDIGKMGVPDGILLKPDKLTEEEWVSMKRHPVFAFEMLSPIAYLKSALDIPYCHHEKWDGTGYPRGLKGEEIPLVARLFAVVDVWDALRSDRPYRPAWPVEKAREYIRTEAGSHFDPEVVEYFLEMTRI